MFWDNVKRRIIATAIYLNHAEQKGVHNVAKSSYYRAATILICTVVEGLVYQLVKRHTTKNGNIVGKIVDKKELHKIDKKIFNTPEDVVICQKVTKEQKIDDSGVTFGTLNVYLKNNKIISSEQYKMLLNVQRERNKIHIQSLDYSDTGYTRAKFEKISEPLDFLTKKLKELM